MAKVDGSNKSLLQGVSQQPVRDRLPGQCTAQINMSSDPVSGLGRRPATDLIAGLGVSQAGDSFYDFETRDGILWLARFRQTGDVVITDLNGDPATVNLNAISKEYMRFFRNLRFTSDNETTYIANDGVVTDMLPEVFPYYNRGQANGGVTAAVIQILGGNYGKKVSINVNGIEVAYHVAPSGEEAEDSSRVTTVYIAQKLESALQVAQSLSGTHGEYVFGTGALGAAPWVVTRKDDVLLVINTAGVAFDLTVSDSFGNANAKAMVGQVKNVSELPRFAPAGYIVRVATKSDPDQDSYYRFVLENNPNATNGVGFGSPGYWVETVALNTPYKINSAHMPQLMTYVPGTRTFNIAPGVWANRTSGTRVSNSDPSFIGNFVNDMAMFQGRLVFISGSNVIMSRTNRFEDFWIKSVENQADTDCIDISANADTAGVMKAVVAHNKDLVIFAVKGQFVVFGRNLLTPKNAALALTTSFEAELRAKPEPSGRNVYFATNYGRYTNIREFFTEGGTDINDTRPVTQHVKEYIEGKVLQLVSSSNYDLLLVRADGDRSIVYPYQFIWADNEKVQSCWSQWKFRFPVDYIVFDEANIYVVVSNNGANELWRMSLDIQDSDGVGYPIHLDNRFDIIGAYTQFLVPIASLAQRDLQIVQGAGCPYPGMLAEIKSITFSDIYNNYVVETKENMMGGNLIVGSPYQSLYEPTTPQVKDKDGTVVSTGKLIVSKFLINIDATGDIMSTLLSKYNPEPIDIPFEGRFINGLDNVIGQPALYSGVLTVPFREDVNNATMRYSTSSHLPMTLLDIEWVGQYVKKGKRISIGGQ